MHSPKFPHSILVQRQIPCPSHADHEFSRRIILQTNKQSFQTPLVLIPRTTPHVFLRIPSSSYYTLRQKWHKDAGAVLPPGGTIYFWPFWNRISHIVTKRHVTYHSLVTSCMTKDNVFVNVTARVVFRIGPDVDAARRFVYRIGAHRFDDLLSASLEDEVKGFCYGVSYEDLNNINTRNGEEEGAAAGGMGYAVALAIREVVNGYGVEIMEVKIQNVCLAGGGEEDFGEERRCQEEVDEYHSCCDARDVSKKDGIEGPSPQPRESVLSLKRIKMVNLNNAMLNSAKNMGKSVSFSCIGMYSKAKSTLKSISYSIKSTVPIQEGGDPCMSSENNDQTLCQHEYKSFQSNCASASKYMPPIPPEMMHQPQKYERPTKSMKKNTKHLKERQPTNLSCHPLPYHGSKPLSVEIVPSHTTVASGVGVIV